MAISVEDSTITKQMSISPCGQYFAVASLAGQLNVWDTITSNLVARYVPSSHLLATCSKLAWPPDNHINISIDNKHPNIEHELKKLIILAIGNENGSICLFSVHKNEVYSIFELQHTKRINDISWLPQEDSLFSCSNDKFVIEWSITQSKIKCKTILDHSVITSICALDAENLITGSNLIKWWNWPSKQLLKTFNGHSTEVQFLRPVWLTKENNGSSFSQTYFISSAVSDRYIYFWKMDHDPSNSNPIRSYLLNDEPITLELSIVPKSIYIQTTSSVGQFYLFEDSIESIENRIKSGPVVPKIYFDFKTMIKSDDLVNGEVTPKNKKLKLERRIPILYGYMNRSQYSLKKSDNRQISLIFGLVNRPIFEQISIQECLKLTNQNSQTILKDSSIIKSLELLNKPTVVNQTTHTKIKSARHSDKTTVIGPAGMVPNQPLFNNINCLTNGDSEMMFNEHDSIVKSVLQKTDDFNNNNLKRKYTDEIKNNNSDNVCNYNKIKKSDELTLDEKLKWLETNENKNKNDQLKNTTLPEKTNTRQKNNLVEEKMDDDKDIRTEVDSLVNVLIQGLQSNDIKMLSTVLSMNKDEILKNTIKKLPTEHVPAFLTVLEKGLCQNGEHHSNYLRWISSLLRHKISFLMTIPNISEEFSSLFQLLKARTAMLEKCYQLKGRLDLIFAQTKPELINDKLIQMKPKLTYESDSSSESDLEKCDDDNLDNDDDKIYNQIMDIDNDVDEEDEDIEDDGEDEDEEDDGDDDDDEYDEDMEDSINEND